MSGWRYCDALMRLKRMLVAQHLTTVSHTIIGPQPYRMHGWRTLQLVCVCVCVLFVTRALLHPACSNSCVHLPLPAPQRRLAGRIHPKAGGIVHTDTQTHSHNSTLLHLFQFPIARDTAIHCSTRTIAMENTLPLKRRNQHN